MFEIKTYLELLSYDYTDSHFPQNPNAKYIDLNDSSKIRNIIDHRKFTPEHIQQLITIKYNNKFIVGFDVPSGLSLWEDSFIPAVERYIQEGKAEILYGIDPIILKFESANYNQVSFSIFNESETEQVYATSILPQKAFIESLLDCANHYWQKLIEYKVFEENELRQTTPRDLPIQMMNTIEELRKKIN